MENLFTNSSAQLFRYLLTVHALACFLVIFQNMMLGLHLNKESTKQVKLALGLCWIVPIIQLPVTLVRFLYSFSAEFFTNSPMSLYLDFFWSPMCTIVLVWLLQFFISRMCVKVSKFVTPDLVYARVNMINVFTALAIGYVLGYAALEVQVAYDISFDVFSRVAFPAVLVLSIFESVFFRFRNGGGLNLTSYIWFSYIGSFIYLTQLVR